MSSSETGADAKGKEDHPIQRGVKEPSPLGSAIFVGLRAVDPLIQYGILARGIGSSLLHKVGIQTLPAGLPINTGVSLIDGLGLSPYRLILLGMATGASAKHIFWLLYTSKEALSPQTAIMVGAFNTITNTFLNLAFTTSLLSASLSNKGRFPQPPLVVGSLLYAIGLATETIAEVQRKNFKEDPKNKGKVYTEGLWKYVRHVNYLGYTVWRSGYAISAGGWTLGALLSAFLVYNFVDEAIPELDAYCSKRYGEQWTEYKRKTPYKLIPGIL